LINNTHRLLMKGRYENGLLSFSAKIKIGVKMVEFSNAVSCSECPMAQCIFYPLTVYYHLKSPSVFRVYIQF
jgi:hypothetical protein